MPRTRQAEAAEDIRTGDSVEIDTDGMARPIRKQWHGFEGPLWTTEQFVGRGEIGTFTEMAQKKPGDE